jgi:uncharacterized membrane protein
MRRFLSRKTFHAIFRAGVLVKAIDSVAEMALGFLFYFLDPRTINKIIFFFSGDELTEQQRDPVWKFFFHGFTGITADVQYFLAFLLIAHGIMKLFLVVGLLKKKDWVYPVSGIAFACFVLYQTYRLTYDPSAWLAILTLFDVIFVALIFHEYSYQKSVGSRQ